MHFDLGQILGFVALAVGTWLGHRVIKPRDVERAQLLERIAMGAAALAVSIFPEAPWAVLLENVVKQIAAAAGVPTKNAAAIERAAAEALTKLGKNPATP